MKQLSVAEQRARSSSILEEEGDDTFSGLTLKDLNMFFKKKGLKPLKNIRTSKQFSGGKENGRRSDR